MSWQPSYAGGWTWIHEYGEEPAERVDLPPGWILGGYKTRPEALRSMEGEALLVVVGHPFANMLRGPPGERYVLALHLPWVCAHDLPALCRHADEAFAHGAFSAPSAPAR